MDDDEAFELLGLASHLMRKLDEASRRSSYLLPRTAQPPTCEMSR